MEGCRSWRRFLLTALAAGGLLIVGASEVRADLIHGTGSAGELPACRCETEQIKNAPPAATPARIDGKALFAALQAEWEAIREELTQSILEATVTAFFIRGGSPPPPPQNQGQTPPNQGGGPPPPPPPPTGGGETPPVDPPIDAPPPQGAPEPASLVIGLLGAGLASLAAWRRRFRV